MLKRPAVFFDRDGVLNLDHGYVHRPEDFAWVEGARWAIKLCNDRGWYVFVVTNQSGVARGLYDEAAVHRLHAWTAEELAREGAHVDAFMHCPHHPEAVVEQYRQACGCRKPEPGMIRACLERWPADAGRSLLIGDNPSDLAAARAAGIKGHLFPGGDLRRFLEPLLDAAAPA